LGYSTNSKKAWFPTHRGGGKIILNVAVQKTAAPTTLRFLQSGGFVKGQGQEFLQARLDGGSLKDFRCKAMVELECIQENDDGFTVLITAHSVMFVPLPKRAAVDYTKDEEAAVAAGYRPCGHCLKPRQKIWKTGGEPETEAYPWRILPKELRPRPTSGSTTDLRA
jgi:hypothetical protein